MYFLQDDIRLKSKTKFSFLNAHLTKEFDSRFEVMII